jgi:hypothetical protein
MARGWSWLYVVQSILLVSLCPIASLFLILLALLSLLLTIFKSILLFSIVAISTPFAVIYNISSLAIFKVWKRLYVIKLLSYYPRVDPRASVGIEVKVMVSDFFKVVAGELLLVLSTGVITFYTAPLLVFYISMAVGVTAILLKWLNTSCLSKTAFSCPCAGCGLNPLMFLFSFIGLFDVGCHPIAKCSFTARKAFLFTDDRDTNRISYTHTGTVDCSKGTGIKFPWDAFEWVYFMFHLRARIDYINRDGKQHILKTSMVLYMWEREICKYHVERLELPEDYTKITELLNFLQILEDGFVTDKMRGRYEHSMTLQEIVDGVQKYPGYRIVPPALERIFVVAGCIDYGSTL